jgi:HEAT repeat protein
MLSHQEQHFVQLIDTYLRYRGIDAVHGTSISKNAYQLLQEFGLENIFTIAQKMLSSEDENMRCAGAEMLMRIDSNRGLPLILPLLQDEEEGVRSFICGIIHDFGDDRAVNGIMQLLMKENDGTVRHHAAFALGGIGTVDIIPRIKEFVEKETATDWEGRSVQQQFYKSIEEIVKRAWPSIAQ